MTIPCENCHTAAGWKPIRAVPEFDHNKTKYPLRGMHEKVQCTECHVKPVFTDVGKNCVDCHSNKDVHRHQMGPDCAQCHTVQGWSIAVQQVKDHLNRFPLLGAHAAVQCEECHKQAATGIFYGLSTECQSCHLTDWQKTNNPPHANAGPAFAPTNCQNCHTNFDSWLGATFNHSVTGFILDGAHATLTCTQCHINNNYNLQNITNSDCGNSGCHLSTWQTTNNPPHASNPQAFPIATCNNCHNDVSWNTSTFNHASTGFPLTNGHANLACTQCHVNNNYNLQIAPTDCGNAGCHLTTWQQTNNPPHASSGAAFAASNCSQCHDTVAWTDLTSFNHSVTGFTLTGMHVSPTPTPCASCHVGNNFTLTIQPNDCGNSSCHLKDWNSTQTLGGSIPNHVTAGFPMSQCSTCHNTSSWATATFNHASTGFPLTNAHASVPCAQCHVNNNYNLQIAASDCGNAGCHLTTYNQTNNPAHASNQQVFPIANCSQCHDTIAWTDQSSFDHSVTGFALTGTHMSPNPTPCASCHVNNNYTLNSADCMSCHQSSWNSTQTLGGSVPNHVTANFPTTASACASCHPITTWADGKFDHSATGFPLTNSHQMAPAGKVTACAQCHVGGNYSLSIQPTDCGNAGCHLTAWQQTNNPPHATSGSAFAAASCSQCHDTIAWTDLGTFNHSVTGFTLTGMHVSPSPTPCVSCHVGNNYILTIQPTDCGNSSCHLKDWNSTQTLGGNVPNHITAGFPMAQCSTCHNTTSWSTATFNHATTGFVLTNAHATVQCALCHVNNNYNLQGISNNDCGNSGCHLTTYNQTNNPAHASNQAVFPIANCSQCHDTIAWTDLTSFNHSVTGFTLTGMHVSPTPTPCASCHVNNNYTLTIQPTDCGNSACHLTTYQQTNNPVHNAQSFPIAQCSTCHNTTSWTSSSFNHSSTGFVLDGLHTSVACTACHVNNNYNLTGISNSNCGNAGCHQTDYNGTNDPVHSAAGTTFLASNCSNCHSTAAAFTTTSWSHTSTGWALQGNHQMSPAGVITNCKQCHVGNNYGLNSAACYPCHTTDWNNTTTLGGAVPNHITSNFPQTCDTCHDMINWADATFNHNNTGFPLTGLHTSVTCTLCHSTAAGGYNLKAPATTCGDSYCHATDYNGTNNPVHAAAGTTFAIANCSNCHSTAAAFTMTSWSHTSTGWALTGNHQMTPAGAATNCNQCHVGNNYGLSVTDCYNSGCHTTDWNSTRTLGGTVPNHVALGYPTSLCSTCHDTISWTDGTFNHASTGWALTGAHLTTTCNLCHLNNNYSLTSANTACYGCHTAEWISTQTLGGSVPNHVTAGYPTTCDSCHTTTNWLGATFNHTYFPIPHHGSVCADCHQVSTDYSQFTCINCHTTTAHQQTQTDKQHQGVGGYTYGPTTCYNCHKNGGG